MKPAAYCLFETPLGWCGIAWSERPNADPPYAVTSFQLPEATPELTESRIARNSGAGQVRRNSLAGAQNHQKGTQTPEG